MIRFQDFWPCAVIAAFLVFTSILAYLRKQKLENQYQRQCPNCGGYRVSGKRPTTNSAYLFHCVICGYQWYWKEGTPWPAVQVQTDLITKGTVKLEQEEEERRKQKERQDTLEGLHHLNQQRRK